MKNHTANTSARNNRTMEKELDAWAILSSSSFVHPWNDNNCWAKP